MSAPRVTGSPFIDDVVIEEPTALEYVCTNEGCHLIHLKAAGTSACDMA